MKQKKMGILGAGSIAVKMADTIRQMESVIPYAIASRDLNKAEAFKAAHGFEKAYGSYMELWSDPKVDFIYIATPHSHHAEQAKCCILAGKPVLCEKAFTKTSQEAKEVLALAAERKVLIAEAIWPRYMPMAQTLKEFVESGTLGKITSLSANLGYNVFKKPRVNDPALAGGSLLDVGVYTLNFASMLFGDDIKKVTSSCVMSEAGVDTQNSVILEYSDGRTATLYSSVVSFTDRMGVLYGEKGFAIVDNINNFEALRIYDKEYKLIEHLVRPAQITGFEYEVLAMLEAMENGWLECKQMPHSEIIRIMELMDSIRHSSKFYYPGEIQQN